ncbi:MAG: RNA methyltransferase [Sphingobacteriia bacterium]|nr:RNA methyltransferase [Sphingobacteriia bacterium]
MTPDITSSQNPRIKQLLRLQTKQSERRSLNMIVVEGFREINLAVISGFEPVEIYFAPEVGNKTDFDQVAKAFPKVYTLAIEPFSRIAYREGSDGLIAIFRPRYLTINDLVFKPQSVYMVLEGVEKPGNLGAALRTADASQIDAVWLCDSPIDLYNPNAIRSSVGCIFTVPVIQTTSQLALDWFKRHEVDTYAAALTATESYHNQDFKRACAIAFGTEADGLTPLWLNEADKQILIPMRGKIDSLNVSVSAAVMIFEVMRQRNFR